MEKGPEEVIATNRTEKLQQVADEFPYYALAQLDLLKSFESNRTPAFHQQAAKTALFFSNTYWLSWQLHPGTADQQAQQKSKGDDSEVKEVPIEAEEEPVENTPATIIPVETPEVEMPAEPVFAKENAETENIIKPIEPVTTETTSTDEIGFEPLHTVDYFASQGIKLSEESVTNDKLTTQLKSFTQWLKSMKKIHAERLPVGDELTDRRIQTIANESNSQAEVLTESMAEVYLKQDKTDKAIEVYSKLSLINPSKSAYFAAKIESLKAS